MFDNIINPGSRPTAPMATPPSPLGCLTEGGPRMRTWRTSSSSKSTPGYRSMVGAWDSSLEYRMSASAVGLLSIRVAAAAARVRSGGEVNDRDRVAVQSVAADLREEARVLRGESSPDVTNETAYAVAGVALTALSQRESSSSPTVDRESDLAVRLDDLASELETLADGSLKGDDSLARLEKVFIRASALVSDSLGQTGELLEGVPEVAEH